ncbi:MAG TPA: hypothetical protein VMB47_06155 [Candidatus Aquilonibacter sp.]|nr:hypothetical protein [Candidatus Aquilonibacter sp.]
MAKKPTVDDARLILELYDLRREAEMRKARQWWLATFWPAGADDFLKVQAAAGTPENNWYRQASSYWNMAAHMVLKGAINEALFFDTSFCGEMYFMFAKVKPFLKELREKTQNPAMFGNIEKAIMGSSVGKQQFAAIEKRVAAMRAQRTS